MKCRHCSAEADIQMIDLGACPPSNDFHKTADEKEKHYPLRVQVCPECWLSQTDISLFKLNHDELFTKDYPYFSSTSPGFVEHARQYVEDMFKRFELTERSNVVEIGSNDGYLLQFVKSRKYGIEPTDTGHIAKAKGIPTYQEFFTSKYAEAIKYGSMGQCADLIVCNNVLPHVPDINDFVKGVSILLNPKGVATFEFPYLVNLMDECQFDTIYHEHYSYLSLTSVERIFKSNGLRVFDVEELPTHGGSLRVYADNSERSQKESVFEMLRFEQEIGVNTKRYYSELQDSADKIKNDLLSFLLYAKSTGKTVVGFGAAAKGNTLLNYAGVRADLLSYVVDETPAKQGKYLPGSRIPVKSDFTSKPDYVLILPWNFRADIMKKLEFIREWGGKFVLAVPEMRVI